MFEVRRRSLRRRAGTFMMVVGLVALLVAGLIYVRDQVRNQSIQERLSVTSLGSAGVVADNPVPSVTPESTDETYLSAMMTTPASSTPPPSDTPSATSTTEVTVTPFEKNTSATKTAAPSATPERPTSTPSPTPRAKRLARIVVPAINLDVPIVTVGWSLVEKQGQTQSVWDTASYAAGHHINSALPGDGGNIVLSGHNNIEGEVFRYLLDLELGDRISLVTDDGRRYVYGVVETMILPEAGANDQQRAANARYIEPNYDEERLTLVTCWPYWSNTHRVIVIATPDVP